MMYCFMYLMRLAGYEKPHLNTPLPISGALYFSEDTFRYLRTILSSGVGTDMPILPVYRWSVELKNRERTAGLES